VGGENPIDPDGFSLADAEVWGMLFEGSVKHFTDGGSVIRRQWMRTLESSPAMQHRGI